MSQPRVGYTESVIQFIHISTFQVLGERMRKNTKQITLISSYLYVNNLGHLLF